MGKWYKRTFNRKSNTTFRIIWSKVNLEELTKDKTIDGKKINNRPVKYFKSYEGKMRVLSFLSRVGIIIALTGYYGYYIPNENAPLIHWIFLFLASCSLLFYSNKEYYNSKNADKKLVGFSFNLCGNFYSSNTKIKFRMEYFYNEWISNNSNALYHGFN